MTGFFDFLRKLLAVAVPTCFGGQGAVLGRAGQAVVAGAVAGDVFVAGAITGEVI